MSSTTWPDGVAARYITLAGTALPDSNLTVNITPELSYDGDGGVDCSYTIACAGCQVTEHWTSPSWVDSDQMRRDLLTLITGEGPRARRWAQSHAETCRAIPRPEQETAS